MKIIYTKILIALNILFWIPLGFDVRLVDGEQISIFGLPIPWCSSSVMGTGDLNVSIPLFIINIFIYFFLLGYFFNNFLERFIKNKRKLIILHVALAFFLLMPVFNLSSKMILGDWSEFVLVPWRGWTGEINSIHFSSGMTSLNFNLMGDLKPSQ